MTRGVTILGSTGSVGQATLDLIANANADRFEIVALTANSNAQALAAQALKLRPRFVALAREDGYEALKHAPTVCNVEDEPDLQFIIKLVTCVMENIRKCQINNDREQSVIEYVREVSECNEAYHQDVFSDMTSIDESELCQRYAVGKELCADLDSLYKENCVSKQTFFNDVTLDGCCW